MGTDIHLVVEEQLPGTRSWRYVPNVTWTNRDYDVFAILANVRNGFGFAGVDTGDGFRPISEPRGLPDDRSAIVTLLNADGQLGDHSFSWLLVSEILNYDWKQITKKRGLVDWAQFQVYREKGHPEHWCGDISGPNIKKVSNEGMALLDEKPAKGTYTTVEWKEPYSIAAEDFLAWLKKDLGFYDAEKTRLVFGFDS